MKDSTVSVRVESDIKEQAEEILNKLGIPVSTLINSLYRQVIIKQGVPFDMTLPKRPKALEEYTKEELDQMLDESIQQMKKGEFSSAEDVFARLKEGLNSEKVQNTADEKGRKSNTGAA